MLFGEQKAVPAFDTIKLAHAGKVLIEVAVLDAHKALRGQVLVDLIEMYARIVSQSLYQQLLHVSFVRRFVLSPLVNSLRPLWVRL